MYKNYFKIAFRSLLKNKVYSFVNILGLAMGFACCTLIALFIKDEWGYDRYHAQADNIYRVTRDFLSKDGSVSLHLGHVAPPFAPLIKNDFPDVKYAVRVLETGSLFAIQENGRQVKAFNEEKVNFAEAEVFKVFDIPLLSGKVETSLNEPFTMLLSDRMAEKYFDKQDPIGKILRTNNQYDVRITGVFKSFPKQSHWHPDFLVSFKTLEDSTLYGKRNLETNWGNNAFATYLLVNEDFSKERTEALFPKFLDKHMGATATANGNPMPSTYTYLYLQKLTDIHLHSHLDSEVEANGDIKFIYLFSAIGLFILLIACINFMNLSTARAANRAKEVGVRKVVGAVKAHLIGQFLSESIIVAFLSLILGCGIAFLTLPLLNTFTDKTMTINLFTNWTEFLLLLAFALVTGILAGVYPAFVLSAFRPAHVLKGQMSSGSANAPLRKGLVIFQFGISVVLIVATGLVFQQLNYMNSKDLGFKKDQIVNLPYYRELGDNYDAFYNELTKNTLIKNVSRSSRLPSTRLLDSNDARAQVGKSDSISATSVVIKMVMTDHHFLDTYQMPLVAGRTFSKEIGTDDTTAFVLNEASVKMIGWKSAEEAINQPFGYGNRNGKIIGVVKDFHFESLHQEIVPIVFFLNPRFYNNLSIKLQGDTKPSLAHVEKVWNQFLPNRPFEYEFLDQRFGQLYESEQKQGNLFIIFSSLAIFIACLGLFGLASYSTLQRTKEIGIRKVMGASIGQIIFLFFKEFAILIGIANLVAFPIAYYTMNEWLENFAYRVGIGGSVFGLAVFISIAIALLTISLQTIKAAVANPVKSLRSE
jgi:putative ABC transport system permease protein